MLDSEAPSAKIEATTTSDNEASSRNFRSETSFTEESPLLSKTPPCRYIPPNSISDEQSTAPCEAPQPRPNLKIIVPAISIGTFLCALDQTVIVSLNPLIGSQLHALHLTSWIATSYFLTLSSIQPLYGRFCDVFGRKGCLLFSYVVFGIGCALCGAAQNMTQLIIARVVQGIGGAGMPTIESVIMSDIVPQKDRGLWQGVINIIFTTGCASGSLLGSLLAESIGWRWVFLGQVPICFTAVLTCAIFLDLPAVVRCEPFLASLRRVDWLGMFLLVASIASFMFGLQQGGSDSWVSPVTISCLLASVVGFGLYLVVEAYVAREPVTPCRLLFSRALLPPYLCNLFGFAAWMAVLFYMPLFFQASNRESIIMSACRSLPTNIGALVGSFGGGWLMRRIGGYYWLGVSGYLLFVLSIAITVVGMTINDPVVIMVGGALIGVGNGCGIVTSLLALVTNTTAEDMATVTAIGYLMRSIGSGIGVSVASTIIQNNLKWRISGGLELDSHQAIIIAEKARRDLGYIDSLPTAFQAVVRLCYGQAIRDSMVAMLALTAISLVSCFFLREKKFRSNQSEVSRA